MPSRKSVKSIISRNHGLGKAKLTDILSSVSSVSLTTDIYTSDANDAYITITAHFPKCLMGNEIVCFRYQRVSW